MDERKMRYIILLCLGMVFDLAMGDRIYLRSGDILTGKIMERREYWNPARDYCDDLNDIVVWDDGTCRCYPKEEIIRVEKEFRKPEGLALSATEDNWGEPNHGYATQLIRQSETFVVGEPMKFGLVMKNVSDSLKWYDHQAISHNTLIIKGPDCNEVYYKKGPFQTCGAGQPIDKGEIVTLFENRNITDEYVITRPGKYSIQFREGNYGMSIDSMFPASNIIEFEVGPGTPQREDLIISSLIDILPNKRWQLARSWYPACDAPAGREKTKKAILCNLFRVARLKKDVITVSIWLTSEPAKINKEKEDEAVSEYLGESSLGHIYTLIPRHAEDHWATIKQDIVSALKNNDDK